MRIPRGDERAADTRYFVAAEDVGRFADEAPGLIEQAVGVTWYGDPENAADRAALTLCRLRRARAGEKGRPEAGDEAVRVALGEVSESALVWLATRAISYMDESGYPEVMERWFGDL
ncbi:MAG: hypothetical protein R6W48_03570 [Gaiellaceae bacterium]